MILGNPPICEEKMRNSTSVLSLVLALGIYGAGPIVTKFGPFAATAALAENENSGSDGNDDSGGDGGDGGSDGPVDGDDSADGADDDSSALSGADGDLADDSICTVNCKITIKKN